MGSRGRLPDLGNAMADTDIEIAIAANALGPKQATVDGVTVQQHSLADQIAADKHLASKRATADPRKAFCRVKIVPPGAV